MIRRQLASVKSVDNGDRRRARPGPSGQRQYVPKQNVALQRQTAVCKGPR